MMKSTLKNPALFHPPGEGDNPPGWVRYLLLLTCGGVSFAHGSNDGQKGMGLIMLALIVSCQATMLSIFTILEFAMS